MLGSQSHIPGVQIPVGAATTAPPHSQIRRPPVSDPQALFDYYVPTRHGVNVNNSNTNPNANPYRQHNTPLSASQPNLASTLAGVQPNTYQYYQPNQNQNVGQSQPHFGSQPGFAGNRQPWYQIKRSNWPSTSQQYFPTKGYGRTVAGEGRAIYQAPVHTQHATPAPAGAASGYYTTSYPSSGIYFFISLKSSFYLKKVAL